MEYDGKSSCPTELFVVFGKRFQGILDTGISRKKVTEEKKAEVLGRITATTDYDALRGCDLIVEAVFEDTGIKAEVTKAAPVALKRADEAAVCE